MPGPLHEAAVLEDFLEVAQSFRFLATFNGKTFDLNLLQDRFTLHRMRCPLLGSSLRRAFPLSQNLADVV